MRLRTLAVLAAAVLAVGVLPASAQQDSGGGLPTDGLPTDGLPTDGLGGGGGQGQAQQQVPDSPGDFIATADGGALEINLAGQSLTVGHSEAGIQSSTDGEACADGLACALASGEALLGESAEVNLGANDQDSDQAAALELDQLEPLLDASVSEATVSASTGASDGEGDTREAAGQGGILSADVSLTEGLLQDLPQDQLTGQLQDILNALQGTAGGDGGGNPLDGLTGQLDPLLGNLDTGQITDILSGSGLGLASTGGDGGGQTSPLQVAQQLVDANQALGGDSSSGSGDGGASGDGGGSADGDGEGGDGLLEGALGGGDGEASADADAGADAGGDSGGDVDADARGSLEVGEGGQAPSPEEVAAIIEQATGEAETSQVTDPTGLIGQLTGTLEQLLGGDLTGGDVASVRVGPTESQASHDTGDLTSASAHSQGAVVVVLPTADSTPQDPQGLATVEVGRATASANSDGTEPAADFDPAVARVTVANPLADGGVEEIAVSPGQSECAGATPLELCVSVGSGSTSVTETGAAASANAVSIRALGGVLPELSVELAAANVGVNAAADEQVGGQEQPPQEQVQQQLPRTGGGTLVPGLLLLGAGAAGFAGLRRRR